jgi:hypothetical protein
MVSVFCPVKVESGPEMKVANGFNFFQFTNLKNVNVYFCDESLHLEVEKKEMEEREKRRGKERNEMK